MQRLQRHFGELAVAWAADASELAAVEGLGLQTIATIAQTRRQISPIALLQQHEQANPHFWTPADAEYPRLLLETPDPPAVLYYRGKVDRQENEGILPLIGIVGTRSPSDYGKRWTRRLTATLIQNGFTVVSGLAEGIDTEAHRSCVDLERRTIAVLGNGVDRIYPWSNRQLQRQILTDGLLLSEYPAGTLPDRVHFPRRNRIIAGISRATIVIEAPERSGALITAHLANEYGRDVYVLPGSLDNPKSIGCLSLLSKGAQVILGEAHLLEMLGTLPQIDPVPVPKQIQLPIDLDPELTQTLQALTELAQERDTEAVPFDGIVQRSGLPTSSVLSALTHLEMLDFVAQMPGMHYRRQ